MRRSLPGLLIFRRPHVVGATGAVYARAVDERGAMAQDEPRERDSLKAEISRRVERVLRVPEHHGTVFRLAWAAAGVILVVAGLAMTVFPGPAIVVIPIGLAMLAGLFAWARKVLDVSIDRGIDMERWLADLDLHIKLIAAFVAAGLVAAVVTAFLADG